MDDVIIQDLCNHDGLETCGNLYLPVVDTFTNRGDGNSVLARIPAVRWSAHFSFLTGIRGVLQLGLREGGGRGMDRRK